MLPTHPLAARDTGGDSTPDEDQGVIRCICSVDDDDGFTIQCENCLVWQHAVCVGVDQDNVPDEYLCEECNPRNLDIKKAVEYQKRRVNSEYKQVKETRKRQRYAPAKGRRPEDPAERRRRATESKHARTKGTKGTAGRESLSPTAVRAAEKGRDGVSSVDSSYASIEQNALGADVQVLFQSVLGQLAEQRHAVSSAAAAVSTAPPPSALVAPDEHSGGHSSPAGSADKPAQNGWTIQHDSNAGAEDKETGTGAHGNEPPAEEADRGARDGLPSMVRVTAAELQSPAPVYRGHAGKDHGQIGLFARAPIERHRYICEYRGHVVLKAAYKEDPKNYYDLLRTTRPYSHFHEDIDLCVDARRQGSEARFARRSCTANVLLRSMYTGLGADALIYLGLFAARDIGADEELTVGWQWDDGELPAVVAMSSSDAEDYLGRPEGRRMSKVWRQVFGGMSCACPDSSCGVRRLFAMLGVEESAPKADPNSLLKRRTGRAPKAGADGADRTELSSAELPTRSPNGTPSPRGVHSRKGSEVGGLNSPGSPSAGRNGVSLDGAGNNSVRDALSLHSIRSSASASRQSSTDTARTGEHDLDPHGLGNGPRSRKRKPSAHSSRPGHGGNGNGKDARRSDSESDCESKGSKKQRSVSASSASQAIVHNGDIPQKKLWITRYLEHTEARAVEQDEKEAPANNSGSTADPDRPADQRTDNVVEPDTRPAADDDSASKPIAAVVATSEPTTEADHAAVVKSEPTDANAPTPSPSMSPGVDASAESTKPSSAAESVTVEPAQPAAEPENSGPESSAQKEPVKAEQPPEPAKLPVKKQRLSLQEYNKRRRGHAGAKDNEGKSTSTATDAGSEKTLPPLPPPPPPQPSAAMPDGDIVGDDATPKADVNVKAAQDPGALSSPPRPPAPVPNGIQVPGAEGRGLPPGPVPVPPFASPVPRPPRPVDVSGRRPMMASPPPPPPPSLLPPSLMSPPPPPPPPGTGPAGPRPPGPGMRMDDRANGGGRDHPYRLDMYERDSRERGPSPYPPAHRMRDKEHGAAERESGEIAHHRDFHARSRSRERGGPRERRYNTFGGGYHSGYRQAGSGDGARTPQRSAAAEWRGGGYGPGGMRALSMSPVQHPPSGGGAPPGPPPGGDGHRRRAGIGSGSRGGSPAHR
ncbi:SET domain-containing protein 3 [Coemansia sp. RSA 552]|nr:SET domain-containing protein 3 [Coemansia sp. RSA 552]